MVRKIIMSSDGFVVSLYKRHLDMFFFFLGYKKNIYVGCGDQTEDDGGLCSPFIFCFHPFFSPHLEQQYYHGLVSVPTYNMYGGVMFYGG